MIILLSHHARHLPLSPLRPAILQHTLPFNDSASLLCRCLPLRLLARLHSLQQHPLRRRRAMYVSALAD